jgi:hypothetical protein
MLRPRSSDIQKVLHADDKANSSSGRWDSTPRLACLRTAGSEVGRGVENIMQVGLDSYAYDGLNMMKEAAGPKGQHDVYIYNADDERVGTIAVAGPFASPSVTPTSYHWTIRGLGNETRSSGSSTTTWGRAGRPVRRKHGARGREAWP